MSSRTQFGFYCCKIPLHYIIKYNNGTGSYFYLHTKKKTFRIILQDMNDKMTHLLITLALASIPINLLGKK